ncbi:hypothetical protein HanIR_Chr05g0212101 [Helianthus annuus]|nr:hypothetical protein HanIR_Chr05g0212101 [Helianthus annuus]
MAPPVQCRGKSGPVWKADSHTPVSYMEALTRSGEDIVTRFEVSIPTMQPEAKRMWEQKALIGEVKELEYLEKMDQFRQDVEDWGIELKYMGGLKVLLAFKSRETAEDYQKLNYEQWTEWFARLYLWDGNPPVFDRVAWIKVTGVPLTLWDRHLFNKIGERCGRLLVKSEVSFSDVVVSEDTMAVLTQSGRRIEAEIKVKWGNQNCTIWVNEVERNWYPAFTSEPHTPATVPMKPIIKSKIVIDGGTDGDVIYDGNMPEVVESLPTKENETVANKESCMGTVHEPPYTPTPTATRSRKGLDVEIGDPHTTEANINDQSAESLGSTPTSLSNLEGNRPSYITIRPRNKSKPKLVGPQTFLTPDLNKELNSDPFNLNEVILQDAEEQRQERMRRTNEQQEIGSPDTQVHQSRIRSLNVTDEYEGNVEEELELADFEKEVGETVIYGDCLGIEMNGFDNQVRKLVDGERAHNLSQ